MRDATSEFPSVNGTECVITVKVPELGQCHGAHIHVGKGVIHPG